MNKVFTSCLAVAGLASCSSGSEKSMPELYSSATFDTTLQGKPVSLYTLKNDHGMTAQITNYGCIVVDLWVPARGGNFENVILGYPSLSDYFIPENRYAGAIKGRYANRIGGARFALDGQSYQLAANNGANTLHGGIEGFDKKVWSARPFTNAEGEQALELTYVSPSGEEHFPGTLTTKVVYTVTRNNEFQMDYTAQSDAPTVINLTNHAYFNLHGKDHRTSINSHVLTLYADQYTPTDSTLVPTGAFAPVAGTALDFSTPQSIASQGMNDDMIFSYRSGYDHNYVVRRTMPGMVPAAEVYEPSTGIRMTVVTDTPGIQFFTGKSRIKQDENSPFYRSSFALETQNYPDAPNHAEFPSSVLRPGETYHQTTVYGFSVPE